MAAADEFIVVAPQMKRFIDQLQVAARHNVHVVLTGEPGSGKSHLARLVHDCSGRPPDKLITVACGYWIRDRGRPRFGCVIPFNPGSPLPIDELRSACDWTIVFDDIDTLDQTGQGRLLYWLDEIEWESFGDVRAGELRPRLVATTRCNLYSLVDAGRFIPQLYYRLTVVELVVPPLRDRPEDIAALAEAFFATAARRLGKIDLRLDSATSDLLAEYSWPENVRQLQDVIERAAVRAGSSVEIHDIVEDMLLQYTAAEAARVNGLRTAAPPIAGSAPPAAADTTIETSKKQRTAPHLPHPSPPRPAPATRTTRTR